MSDDQARNLFSADEENPFENDYEQPVKKEKKHKKKHKKDKKKKKKRREFEDDEYGDFDEEEEEEEENEYNQFFDEEASIDDADEEEISGELGFEEDRQRYDELLFGKPRAADEYFSKLNNKSEKQLQAEFLRQANKRREAEQMYPAKGDPKLFWVNVRPNHEDEMVLCILNKARHLAKTANKVTIVSALSMKKKYPGRILVEAFNERDIRESLDGFNNVNLSNKKIVELELENYAQLFNRKAENKTDFKQGEFVRITKGLYEGDLGKIERINKNVLIIKVVPRINVQDLEFKIRDQTSKMTGDEEIEKKKSEIFKVLTNHKVNFHKNRPNKAPLDKNSFDNIRCTEATKLILDQKGNLHLRYKPDEIRKVQGTYLPVEVLPLTNDNKLIDAIEQERKHFTTSTNFKKGEDVEIVAGELARHHGILVEIRDSVGIIKCKNKEYKELYNVLLEEPLEHLAKRFKKGQRVKVISGADAGKSGLILEVEPRLVEIWTDNNNSIKINKNNLELYHGEAICQDNVHGLKKDDLIKTTKNVIGIVIETQKDNIKILDTNNTIQIISNMDFDSTINTRNLAAKNRTGEEITTNSSVRIRDGTHEGKRCVVKHVYRQFVFLFNQSFDRTAGISVESADNCSLISKNDGAKKPLTKNPVTSNNEADEIIVGKTITLRSGPLKGYQGIVKSINKDKIEVRVPSKSCTEWVQRDSVASKQSSLEVGKTPNRRVGMSVTHNYGSPGRY